MAVTLHDVAKLAGVSVGTASQALNNNPKVNSETRSRVIDAANTLGYVIKEKQDYLAAHQSPVKVIGVLSKHDVGDVTLVNPFYSHICAGIEAECRKLGIGLMISGIEVDLHNRPVEWPAMLENKLVDGLIFVGTHIEDIAQAVKNHLDVPIILIDSYTSNHAFDCILTDNYKGAEMAVQHLLDLGHRHIGLIGSKQHSVPSIAERRMAYIHTLQALGVFDENYIYDSELSRPSAYEGALSIIRLHSEISAIFACNDDCASGVLAAVRELGLRVPEDISIVGFDNISISSEYVPPLTTVHVHKNWMGILGVRFLLERAANPEKPKTTTLISTQLVVRKSTAPPRR